MTTSSPAALSSIPLHIIVGDLVEQTGLSQRDLAGMKIQPRVLRLFGERAAPAAGAP